MSTSNQVNKKQRTCTISEHSSGQLYYIAIVHIVHRCESQVASNERNSACLGLVIADLVIRNLISPFHTSKGYPNNGCLQADISAWPKEISVSKLSQVCYKKGRMFSGYLIMKRVPHLANYRNRMGCRVIDGIHVLPSRGCRV
jgi:hypothetical protein